MTVERRPARTIQAAPPSEYISTRRVEQPRPCFVCRGRLLSCRTCGGAVLHEDERDGGLTTTLVAHRCVMCGREVEG